MKYLGALFIMLVVFGFKYLLGFEFAVLWTLASIYILQLNQGE